MESNTVHLKYTDIQIMCKYIFKHITTPNFNHITFIDVLKVYSCLVKQEFGLIYKDVEWCTDIEGYSGYVYIFTLQDIKKWAFARLVYSI